MNEGGGSIDDAQVTRQQRTQAMLDLSNKYGASAKIPEEELSTIGYVRKIMKDGTIRLIPQERLLELEKKDPNWELSIKDKERPFGRISVNLATTDHTYRFIPREQKKILKEKLLKVECAFFPNWHDGTSIIGDIKDIDFRLHNLRMFSSDFLNFIKERKILGAELEDDVMNNLFFMVLPVRKISLFYDPNDQTDFRHEDVQKRVSELDGSVTSEFAKQAYDDLTRLGGYYSDVAELSKDFQNRLALAVAEPDEYIDPVESYLRPYKEARDYLKSQGIHTYVDFIRYTFSQYLEYAGLTEMAQVIKNSEDLHNIANTLKAKDTSDGAMNQEKDLRKRIKTATQEERIVLSKQLKEIEEAKKKKTRIRLGVIDYFSSPEVYAEICKRQIKEAQDFLVTKKGDEKGKEVFYLDATPNEEFDKDPGQVSGDCTAGKPLPFEKPDLPIYNVKVFDNGGRHQGNMYHLVTNTVDTDEKKKVWHYDAIQIPVRGIDWGKSIELLVDELAKQAELKGVEVITVNSEVHQISNYDYIAHAVKHYWDTHGRQMVSINIPDVNDSEHSNFQGTGTAIVLWSKNKLSEAYEGELEENKEFFNL